MAQNHRHPLMIWLSFLRYLTAIAAVFVGACFGMNLYGNILILIDTEGGAIRTTWFTIGISLYGLFFVALIILTEVRAGWFFEEFPALNRWLVRGLFYLFVGLLVNAAQPVFDTTDENVNKVLPDIIFGVGCGMCIIGLMYLFMMCCCLHDKARALALAEGSGSAV